MGITEPNWVTKTLEIGGNNFIVNYTKEERGCVLHTVVLEQQQWDNILGLLSEETVNKILTLIG